jgi:hypothetical protein
MFADLNILALMVSAVVTMAIGFAWYSPALFGSKWLLLSGVDPNAEGKSKNKMFQSMAVGFVSALITAYVLSRFVKIAGATTLSDALLLAFWLWFGFTATVQISVVLWEQKPWGLFLINTAYSFVSFAVVAMIVTLWT